MKPTSGAKKPIIRIAVVESDPLRFIGLKSLFDTEPDLELVSEELIANPVRRARGHRDSRRPARRRS